MSTAMRRLASNSDTTVALTPETILLRDLHFVLNMLARTNSISERSSMRMLLVNPKVAVPAFPRTRDVDVVIGTL
jgi:hypothetical protein